MLISGILKNFKIISGGQTGADRAALDWAIAHGVPHGGWCPKGRWAEDGPIPRRYHLQQTPSADPPQRTEWNVRDSDATVIFSIHPNLSGGTLLTAQLARKYHKPLLQIAKLAESEDSVSQAAHAKALCAFLQQHKIKILNVAGPRASGAPDIADFVRTVLDSLSDAR